MDNRGYAGTTESRKLVRQTTRQLVNETTSGAAAGNMDLRNYGFTELRKLTSLCYAGQQTTDNGQRRAKPAHCSRLTTFLYLLYPSIHSIPFDFCL